MNIFDLFLGFVIPFGFNGNIFETNIINLSFVLGFVLSFGLDALRALLDARKQTILKNFDDVKKRTEDARTRVNDAYQQVLNAKIKAQEIDEQTVNILKLETEAYSLKFENEKKRLETLKEETFISQEQKSLLMLSKQIIGRAVSEVEHKIQSNLTPRLHDSVNNFHIVLLRKMSV